MDISTRPARSFVQDDQTWLGNGGEPVAKPRSIVLDRDLFNLVGTWDKGYLPSGIVLGQVTATKKWGPYAGPMNERQTVNLGAATAGTVTITFQGNTTSSLAYNATTAQVQAALEALANVNPNDIVVSGGPWPGTNMTLTFQGQFAGTDVSVITATPTGLTGGTVTIATAQAGGATANDGRETAKGLLFAAIPYDRNSIGDMAGALFWNGEVIESKLPSTSGVTGTAKTHLTTPATSGAYISFV